ncbi:MULTISPECIES: hypothetical protein [unclassified Lentimonas]|uniref:hypothetical protein n=1 Tax=unclassified Lentimonas TaxID=2630993 RepID=UPI001324F39E|nr:MULTISPECIES: hypothetical protein [unclassified Lentimonas]CAA6679779.1 Unannotated [Lentimonas sp. CC4]CAA6685710.1 Unannotated [Lentimonas sp. CC6]CAA7077153.1 Unannotated [Lentimonas sp. CC4]CAA7168763.1 Unannotated [Lentimonas sp. CC21]CAA7180869.1 Unannotated [Lentimonas sp. CC8]
MYYFLAAASSGQFTSAIAGAFAGAVCAFALSLWAEHKKEVKRTFAALLQVEVALKSQRSRLKELLDFLESDDTPTAIDSVTGHIFNDYRNYKTALSIQPEQFAQILLNAASKDSVSAVHLAQEGFDSVDGISRQYRQCCEQMLTGKAGTHQLGVSMARDLEKLKLIVPSALELNEAAHLCIVGLQTKLSLYSIDEFRVI